MSVNDMFKQEINHPVISLLQLSFIIIGYVLFRYV